jgi:hypothetical protein
MAGPARNNRKSSAVEKRNPDGLPLPDDSTFAALRAEARREKFDLDRWADLCAFLAWIAEQDRRGAANPELPEGATTSELALRMVLTFLEEQSPFLARRGALAPLLRLDRAIVNLANGRVSPILKPVVKNRGGNPGMGVPDEVIEFAARAMDELIQADFEHDKAAEMVATTLQTSGYCKVTAETITNWRDGCKEGSGGRRVSDLVAAQFRKPLPPHMGNTPARRAANLLKLLKRARVLSGT